MKEILRQLYAIFNEMKPMHRAASVAVLLLVAALLGFLLCKKSSATFVPLYPGNTFTPHQRNEMCVHLDSFSIPYKEEGDHGILVSSEYVDQARFALNETGVLKKEVGKGFELFDTNTWIKGEKELQVLEMRALKGQLEKDLTTFEQVKSANVILDIPPQKSFSGPKLQTKASVILSLKQGTKLSSSALRAITNHLAGAVRGLEPKKIAISDTTGRVYKTIDPEGVENNRAEFLLHFEEQLEEKISELLECLAGQGRYHTMIQLLENAEGSPTLSIAVVIDKYAFSEPKELCKQEIERQLAAIARGYGYHVEPVVDFIPFYQKNTERQVSEEISSSSSWLLYILLGAILLILTLFCFYGYLRKSKVNEDAIYQAMTKIDMKKLASSIENEDPQVIALMLSYLQPAKAEQLIAALHKDVQEEVLFHLSELEKE